MPSLSALQLLYSLVCDVVIVKYLNIIIKILRRPEKYGEISGSKRGGKKRITYMSEATCSPVLLWHWRKLARVVLIFIIWMLWWRADH